MTRAHRRAPALRRVLRARWAACRPAPAPGGGPRVRASGVDCTRSQAYQIPLYPPWASWSTCGRQEQWAVEPGAEYEQVRDRVIAALRTGWVGCRFGLFLLALHSCAIGALLIMARWCWCWCWCWCWWQSLCRAPFGFGDLTHAAPVRARQLAACPLDLWRTNPAQRRARPAGQRVQVDRRGHDRHQRPARERGAGRPLPRLRARGGGAGSTPPGLLLLAPARHVGWVPAQLCRARNGGDGGRGPPRRRPR